MNYDTDQGNVMSYNNVNPTICSPHSQFEISFYQTRDSLMNTEDYKRFLENAIKRFRFSSTYRHYKSFLHSIGMDRCQFHSNITADMCNLEMHHNIITIFDIALIISEHILRTVGYISTFDLVAAIREEHIKHRVQLVMLSETPHQLYHNSDEMIIHPQMCFGKWWEFLQIYHMGITTDVGRKIINNIDEALKAGSSDPKSLLDIRSKILDWSWYNEYGYDKNINRTF